MTTVAASKWLRVNRHNPCPICEKPDWCLVFEDGKTAICARIESDKPAGNKGAGWIHKIGEDHTPLPSPAPKQAVKQLPIAPIDRRTAVYQALLSQLNLSDDHKANLLRRGLTQEQIDRLQYRSMPTDDRRTIVHELTKSGLNLGGVPGFWMQDSEVRLSGAPGILIPVRDMADRIQACQIRCDHVDQGGKYRWLSSAGKPCGCSSGCPVHIVRPEGSDAGEVWITEGPLKADISALKLKRAILAVGGVGSWPGVIPVIRQLKPERVIISFDMDKNRKGGEQC